MTVLTTQKERAERRGEKEGGGENTHTQHTHKRAQLEDEDNEFV